MKIIQEREIVEYVRYFREFTWREGGGGFSFDCDAAGNLENPSPEALENFRKCVDGTFDVVDNGVREMRGTYTAPGVGRCDCGEEVELSRFTSTCHGCGADYNSAGQRLAPREQWGIETGERWFDCY